MRSAASPEQMVRTFVERADRTRHASQKVKQAVLTQYAPLVKYVVSRIAAGLPKNVDQEDLFSAGVLGLLDALEKFDAKKGTKFETYAVWRIRGSVLDELRALDWASRSTRRKAREIEEVCRKLDQKLGRSASDTEVAKALGIPVQEYLHLLDEIKGAVLLSLDRAAHGDDQDSGTLGECLDLSAAEDPLEVIESEEDKVLLGEAINQLPEQERLVIALYYFEEMTLREIGETLTISESRVSQVHTSALMRLRGRVRRMMMGEAA
jgi:RNA polymerase sigma factor for flagellar operon FliA